MTIGSRHHFDDRADRVAAEGALEVEAASHEGMRIGAYRTLRLVGRGGMGTVYLAERADGQFDQRVAPKVIPLGMDSDAAVRRFVAERQIVARLDHPHRRGPVIAGASRRTGARPWTACRLAACGSAGGRETARAARGA